MTRRDAARLIAINAAVSVALLAGGARWVVRPERPTFAILDIAELYRAKESQIAAVLVQHDSSAEERATAIKRATGFGTEMAALIETLPEDCSCLVLNRGAVVGASGRLPDLTSDVRRRLGL